MAGVTTSSRAQMDVEFQLRRQNDELCRALDFERNRAAQAERAADELRAYSRTNELQLQSSMLTVDKDSDSLGQEPTKLRKEGSSI
jgi:hypothetical protein